LFETRARAKAEAEAKAEANTEVIEKVWEEIVLKKPRALKCQNPGESFKLVRKNVGLSLTWIPQLDGL
jgi:hypothetical protein